jgi:hypothetical protein
LKPYVCYDSYTCNCPKCCTFRGIKGFFESTLPDICFRNLLITQDESSWAVLKPDVFAAIMDHFSSGEPLVLDEEALAKSDTAIHPEDDEVNLVL